MSLYKFRYYNSNFKEWDECYIHYKPKLVNAECPHCASHPLMIQDFYKAFDAHCQRYQCPTCEELFDIKATLTASLDDLNVIEIKDITTVPSAIANDLKSSSIVKGLKNSNKNFTSLKYFKALGYEIKSIDSEVIILYNADNVKGITLSIKPSSQRTYYSDSCLSGKNGGLSRDELKALYLFWEEYDEKIEIYEDEEYSNE